MTTFFVGIVCTIVLTLRLVEFFAETDPIEYFSETSQDLLEEINLREIGFSFAIEQIEEEFGSIEVHRIDWSGIDGSKKKTKIIMEECEILRGSELSIANEFSMMRSGNTANNTFLCPSDE